MLNTTYCCLENKYSQYQLNTLNSLIINYQNNLLSVIKLNSYEISFFVYQNFFFMNKNSKPKDCLK